MGISKDTGQFLQLVMDRDSDASLTAAALEFSDKIAAAQSARRAARERANGCPACEFLLQVCEDGKVVCKVCGRDDEKEMGADTIIDKLGGNDLTLE